MTTYEALLLTAAAVFAVNCLWIIPLWRMRNDIARGIRNRCVSLAVPSDRIRFLPASLRRKNDTFDVPADLWRKVVLNRR